MLAVLSDAPAVLSSCAKARESFRSGAYVFVQNNDKEMECLRNHEKNDRIGCLERAIKFTVCSEGGGMIVERNSRSILKISHLSNVTVSNTLKEDSRLAK